MVKMKAGLGILVGVAALGTLFIVGAGRSRSDATPAAAPSTRKMPATDGPVLASALLEKTPLEALDEKVLLLEERTKELQARRDRAAADKKENELQVQTFIARESAKGYTGRWMSDYKLTDAQREPMHSLLEKWLCEDAAREEYRALDARTFQARESELRSLLTPDQQQARHEAVKGGIEDLWKSLAIEVSRLREGLHPGFLMMGPPWTPESRALADRQLLGPLGVPQPEGLDVAPPLPPPDTSLLGECPAIPESVLLADAHDLGILGLWRKAEPRVRSLLTADQLEKYAQLLPGNSNLSPHYLHGY